MNFGVIHAHIYTAAWRDSARGDWLRQCALLANHDSRGEEVLENLFPPMRCGTGKGQVAGCGVAPTRSLVNINFRLTHFKK
jgi:hypothetical protein